jgi:hypothetical protein
METPVFASYLGLLNSFYTANCARERPHSATPDLFHYNYTGYTSVKATSLHLNKKPGNSTIKKTPTSKSIPIWNKSITEGLRGQKGLKAQRTKNQDSTRTTKAKN